VITALPLVLDLVAVALVEPTVQVTDLPAELVILVETMAVAVAVVQTMQKLNPDVMEAVVQYV
jgi:hypothetical protein